MSIPTILFNLVLSFTALITVPKHNQQNIITDVKPKTQFVSANYETTDNPKLVVSDPVPQNPQSKSVPKTIIITKINLNTHIEPVGLTPTGNLDTPINDINAGWYKYGPIPGEAGNSVIDGHYDSRNGAPGAFHGLKHLNVGDEIQVIDSEGKTITFEIYKKEIYPETDFPLNEIFGQTQDKNLNLITCTGIFDKSVQEYRDRLVIFAKLKEL
jgi:LPXTG-site transpeptidase (sortase) family protein